MSSVTTLLASVGVSQVCSPYSSQLSSYSFVIIRISKTRTFNELDHFVGMEISGFMENRYVVG